ncbi:s-adenosylmethionine synthetase [Holotrichia oblita]|nr:s-adenosylmethionine synthetase [Holotrichia oblita]
MKLKHILSEIFCPSNIKCVVCDNEIFDDPPYSLCDNCNFEKNDNFCISCGRGIPDMSDFCDYCKQQPCDFTAARAPFLFEGNIRLLIHKLKYGGARYLAEIFAKYLADIFSTYGWKIDEVTFVPMHKKRLRERGYNQTELIANDFCSRLCLPLKDYLLRIKHTDNLAQMNFKEREKAIKNAIAMKKGEKCARSVLLIDDVFTTGATAEFFLQKPDISANINDMKWIEVCIVTSSEFADIVSLTLIEHGSEGTVIKDSSDIKELMAGGVIWDYVDEPLLDSSDIRVLVSGFFTVGIDIKEVTERLLELKENAEFETGAFEISIKDIESSDWENEWKKYYMPLEFSSFAIVPEWIKNHGIKDKKIIMLNPGMAFGTGSHETTSMCLKLMDDINFDEKTVIDLGCGSGILGISAAVLGAKKVLLTDIDPYAIKCAGENTVLNNLVANTKILEANLLDSTIGEKADILTANLTAPLLLLAKEGIKKHINEQAIVIISGILKDYNNEVMTSYKQDFDIAISLTSGEWCAHLLLGDIMNIIKGQKLKFFSSESITEGHPDKICDLIADTVLDTALSGDPQSRIACEVCCTTGLVMVMGEFTTEQYIDIPKIVRQTVKGIGYDNALYGFDGNTCAVITSIDEQSKDIADGVSNSYEKRSCGTEDKYSSLGAGDQGIMFGCATDETKELMPLPITVAHALTRKLTEVRKNGIIKYLRPDGKSQVTVAYEGDKPLYIDTVLISAQHDANVSIEQLQSDIKKFVIEASVDTNLLTDKTKYLINPSGRFVIGGPMGDSGLTGRKIIADTYGGMCRHGGGAFSGKDATKVDRSASYYARYVCKNVVAAKIAKRCEIQIAYAIGKASPLSVYIDTFGTSSYSDEEILAAILKVFDFRPASIIESLQLTNPIFAFTSNYGHFGKSGLSWEKVDKTEALLGAIKN